MIYVKGVSLKIKKDMILSDIDLHIEKGKITGLVGRNGSGKTMLMKCITGFVKPTAGEIIFSGKKIGEDVDFPANTGIILETPSFVPFYSGYKNLYELASLNHKTDKSGIEDILKKVGLYEAKDKLVKKYSLGMNPDTLILDEPMNGLDNACVKMIREILLDLKKEGKTILLVSHNFEDIKCLCDKIYEIDHGKLMLPAD